MTGHDFMARLIAERARELDAPSVAPAATLATPARVVEGLRRALLDGETHYTDRPGMAPLREHIAASLSQTLGTARGKDTVIVTNSDTEALFACLLGLRAASGGDNLTRGEAVLPSAGVVDDARARDGALARLLGFDTRLVDPPFEPAWVGRFEVGTERCDVLRVSGLDATSIRSQFKEAESVVVGTLAGGPRVEGVSDGLSAFPVGFACVTPGLAKHARTWKQALSICTAAPSQRATLLALNVEGAS